jgi:hypothetical protein
LPSAGRDRTSSPSSVTVNTTSVSVSCMTHLPALLEREGQAESRAVRAATHAVFGVGDDTAPQPRFTRRRPPRLQHPLTHGGGSGRIAAGGGAQESLIRRPEASMRFSESSCRAVKDANREAQRHRQAAVGTSHLLLSLLQDETCGATALLREVGADVPRLRQSLESKLSQAAAEEPLGTDPLPAWLTLDEKRIEELVRAGKVIVLPPEPGRLPQTSALKRSIERAIEESRKRGTSREALPGGAGPADVGTEHLLLGLLLQGNGAASTALASAGVDAVRVQDLVGRRPTG